MNNSGAKNGPVGWNGLNNHPPVNFNTRPYNEFGFDYFCGDYEFGFERCVTFVETNTMLLLICI